MLLIHPPSCIRGSSFTATVDFVQTGPCVYSMTAIASNVVVGSVAGTLACICSGVAKWEITGFYREVGIPLVRVKKLLPGGSVMLFLRL